MTHITLIPKELDASFISNFRPISLLSGCFKILAKDLANQLKPLLALLVSEFQSASVEGKQIQNVSLLANELLDSHLLSKRSCLMFKVDFIKTFESMSWNFLDSMLGGFSFGKKWRD